MRIISLGLALFVLAFTLTACGILGVPQYQAAVASQAQLTAATQAENTAIVQLQTALATQPTNADIKAALVVVQAAATQTTGELVKVNTKLDGNASALGSIQTSTTIGAAAAPLVPGYGTIIGVALGLAGAAGTYWKSKQLGDQTAGTALVVKSFDTLKALGILDLTKQVSPGVTVGDILTQVQTAAGKAVVDAAQTRNGTVSPAPSVKL